MCHSRKGFTLIELLIVIAIVAVLAAVVILTLNPAELLRSARDSERISDLVVMNKALNLYRIDHSTQSMGSSSVVYVSIPDNSSICANLGLPALPGGWTYHCSSSSTYTNIDGTGWIPVDLNSLSFSSPVSRMLVDPLNETSSGLYYTYTVVPGGWEINTVFESQKYINIQTSDAGDDDDVYESGSLLTLAPPRSSGGAQQDTGYILPSSHVLTDASSWRAPSTGWYTPEDPPFFTELAQASSSNTLSPTVTFSGFSFGIPGGSSIDKICVVLENVSQTAAPQGIQRWDMDLSWNGGSTFTSANTLMPDITITTATGTTRYFTDTTSIPGTADPGASCTTWGRSWSSSEMSAANFAVRLSAFNASSSIIGVRFDVVRAKIYYTP